MAVIRIISLEKYTRRAQLTSLKFILENCVGRNYLHRNFTLKLIGRNLQLFPYLRQAQFMIVCVCVCVCTRRTRVSRLR